VKPLVWATITLITTAAAPADEPTEPQTPADIILICHPYEGGQPDPHEIDFTIRVWADAGILSWGVGSYAWATLEQTRIVFETQSEKNGLGISVHGTIDRVTGRYTYSQRSYVVSSPAHYPATSEIGYCRSAKPKF
jgi:hypothetical protein